jgi:MFS family permease
VIFPWLAVVVLGLAPERMGLAQMALMAPSIVFTLLGGALADRADTRRLLYRYHVVAALPPLALAATVAGGGLSYAVLVAYGLAMGTFSALIVPARDALLSRVAIGWVPRAVAVASAVSLICQLTGIAMGAAAGSLGAPVLLIAQAAVLIAGAVATARTVAAPPPETPAEGRLSAIASGLHEAWTSERIFPVMVVMLAVGTCFVGSFVVVVPLVARDDYGAGSAGLALFNGCFFGGTVTSILAQIRLAPPRRPGRVIMITRVLGSGVLAAMAVRGPMALLATLCLVWGMGRGRGAHAGPDDRADGRERCAPRPPARDLSARHHRWRAAGRRGHGLPEWARWSPARRALARRRDAAGRGLPAGAHAPVAAGGGVRRVLSS